MNVIYLKSGSYSLRSSQIAFRSVYVGTKLKKKFSNLTF